MRQDGMGMRNSHVHSGHLIFFNGMNMIIILNKQDVVMMGVTYPESVPFPYLIVKILYLLFCLNFINGNFVHLRVMGTVSSHYRSNLISQAYSNEPPHRLIQSQEASGDSQSGKGVEGSREAWRNPHNSTLWWKAREESRAFQRIPEVSCIYLYIGLYLE